MLKTNYHVAILTASDKGSVGERKDESGPLIKKMMENAGYTVAATALLSDDEIGLSSQMKLWAESGAIDLILTTGGTGFSARDHMPEATLSIATRMAPGISEAIRSNSLAITPHAMLSRATSVICRNTLIVNMPGSPKAVKESLEYILPALGHGLEILTGNGGECAR